MTLAWNGFTVSAENVEDESELWRRLALVVAKCCPAELAGDADDLVQVAWLRVRAHAAGEGNPPLPASYLWRVACSAVIDELRRRARRREETLDDGWAESLPGPTPDPERTAGSAELGRAVRAALATLAPPRRRAVTLHLLGHPVPEIARLLGWGERQADNLVYRGLAELRSRLAEKGWRP